jgi:hypothetical protein
MFDLNYFNNIIDININGEGEMNISDINILC